MQTVGVGNGQGGRWWQSSHWQRSPNAPPDFLPLANLLLWSQPRYQTPPQVLDPRTQNPRSHHDPWIAGLRGQCFVGLVVRGEAGGRYLNSSHVYDLPL